MLSRGLLMFLLSVSVCGVKAQTIEPEVIATAGDVFSDGTNTLEWTMGELSIESFDNGSNVLTQGFHQPYAEPSAVLERSFDWKVYPNPSNGQNIYVVWSGSERPESLVLYNLSGKEVRRVNTPLGTTSIVLNFPDIEDGMYLLVVQNEDYQETVRLSITH